MINQIYMNFECSCTKMTDVCAESYDSDECDIPLREGLDLDELRHGEGQMFEVDEERMTDYGMSQ